MSSWGVRPFEDDLALDWLDDLWESDPLAFFDHCLDIQSDLPLDYLACVGVRCTTQVILLLLDLPDAFAAEESNSTLNSMDKKQPALRHQEAGADLPISLNTWLKEHPHLQWSAAARVTDAVFGITHLLDQESEMHVRWADAGQPHHGQWLNQLQQMQRELRCRVAW